MWASDDYKTRRIGEGVNCRVQCWKTNIGFGLAETLGCPHGWVYACNVSGHHRSPSLLLVPGLEIGGSWYVSPLEDLSLE